MRLKELRMGNRTIRKKKLKSKVQRSNREVLKEALNGQDVSQLSRLVRYAYHMGRISGVRDAGECYQDYVLNCDRVWAEVLAEKLYDE